MVFNFSILQKMDESLDRGITDVAPTPAPAKPAPVLRLAPAPAKPKKIERRRITDTAPPSLLTMGRKPRPTPEAPEAPETTLVQLDTFISTEGLSYTPLPPANQMIIDTLFA